MVVVLYIQRLSHKFSYYLLSLLLIKEVCTSDDLFVYATSRAVAHCFSFNFFFFFQKKYYHFGGVNFFFFFKK